MTPTMQEVWYLYSDGPPTDGSDVYSSPPELFTSMEGALRYLEHVEIGSEAFHQLLWLHIRPGFYEAWNPAGNQAETIHLACERVDAGSVHGHDFPSTPSVIAPGRILTNYAAFRAQFDREVAEHTHG